MSQERQQVLAQLRQKWLADKKAFGIGEPLLAQAFQESYESVQAKEHLITVQRDLQRERHLTRELHQEIEELRRQLEQTASAYLQSQRENERLQITRGELAELRHLIEHPLDNEKPRQHFEPGEAEHLAAMGWSKRANG